DKLMDKKTMVRNYTMTSELGHVKYICTDKTGTLTNNCIILRYISYVNKENQLESIEFDNSLHLKRDMDSSFVEIIRNMLINNSAFINPDYEEIAQLNSNKDSLKEYYLCTSQDEEALIYGLLNKNFKITSKSYSNISLDMNGITEDYFLTSSGIEFTSEKKYMVTVVKYDDQYIAYAKGATENLLPLIKKSTWLEDYEMELEQFYKLCFRVLCFCWATFDHDPSEEELMSPETYAFLGFTVQEDTLADDVPDTIKRLKCGGIYFRVLTGDNSITAKNIAEKCELIDTKQDTCIIDPKTIEISKFNIKSIPALQYNDYAIFDSEMTRLSLQHPEYFSEWMKNSKCIIFSRVTPSQKAEIVEVIKEVTKETVLAVGDGANDVSMIKKSNLGVGIVGKEGKLAANAGDFSIHNFRFLAGLVLVHGAWNYERTATGMLFFIYKNLVFVVPSILFIFILQFRITFLYDSIASLLFTLMFTSFLILPISALDRRLSSKQRLKYPTLYKASASKRKFTLWNVTTWFLNGIFHGTVVFFIVYYSLADHDLMTTSNVFYSFYDLGNLMLTAVVLVVTGKSIIESFHISCFLSLFSASSIIFLALYFLVFNFIGVKAGWTYSTNGVLVDLFGSFWTYCILLLCIAIALTRDLLWKLFKREYFWRVEDLFFDNQQGLEHRLEQRILNQVKQRFTG
ncbi:MAG: Phospholipid-transporting ATPase IA, partial [Paramarteilia canceri]